jgi:hypothetical protein
MATGTSNAPTAPPSPQPPEFRRLLVVDSIDGYDLVPGPRSELLDRQRNVKLDAPNEPVDEIAVLPQSRGSLSVVQCE